MGKKHKKATLFLVIILLICLVSYNLVKSTKTKGEKISDKNIVSSNRERESNKNSTNEFGPDKSIDSKKERNFKDQPLIHNDKSIPVLMYHSIDYEKGNELRVPKEKFREQMKYLKDKGYTTLTFDELYDFLLNNKPVPEKSVVITFDDGYEDNYINAYPILKEFGFNAVIFVITNAIDKEKNFLTSKELQEMDSNGIDIESHTVSHDQLDKLTYDKQMTTLKESKEYIEKVLNKQVKYIGYPFGKWNNDSIKALKDSGYTMAFTTIGGWANKNQGIYTLDRVYVSANFGMNEFQRRLTNPNYTGNSNSNNKNSKKR